MLALHGKTPAPGLTFAALWQRRRLLVSLVTGAVISAGLLLLVIPPVYTGETLVALSVRTGQVFDGDQPVAVPPTLGQVQTEMEVLRSRGLAAQVVDQLSLTKDPEFNAALRPTPEPLRRAADRLGRIWAILRLGLPGEPRPEPIADDRSRVIDAVMKGLSVTSGAESFAIHVRYEARLPDKAAMLANSFADIYAANRADIEKADSRVVSRATSPTMPSHPQPLLFLGVAVVGALGLGVALVGLLEHFRSGYISTLQVKSELGLPTLGVVPHLPRLPREVAPSDYMLEKPTSIYAEAIKAAQLAILDCRADGKGKRILVASSVPGEGKTAFAISLARSMATSGYRVLLMDCDFRRPAVGRYFAVENGEVGLCDLLRQIAPVERVVRRDQRTGLYYACAGMPCRDPQKLLDSTFAVSVLAGLMTRFDVAIIDSPPTMVASDSAVLARLTDLILYVVAWDKTPRGAVQAGVDYLKSHGGQVAGVVLSKVDLTRGGGYGDYAYRYGEYYAK